MRGPRPLGVVIKLGTSSIVDEKTHEPLLSILTSIVETAVKLRKDGHKVIIVSSGAIGVGLRRMDVDKRPKHLSKLQALAAIGQCRLMSLWDSLFTHLMQPIAQILLTRSDIADRSRYLNAQRTINELLDMGVIPIVNENDTLAVSEIKFGDNDTLSAITAAMVHADLLFLMTDVDALYDKNPRTHPDAHAIEVVEDIGALVVCLPRSWPRASQPQPASQPSSHGPPSQAISSRSSNTSKPSRSPPSLATKANQAPGTPGTLSRNQSTDALLHSAVAATTQHQQQQQQQQQQSPHHSDAERTLTSSPIPGSTPNSNTTNKIPLHTRFLPSPHPVRDRYFWILHGLRPHGTLYIDQGAYKALVGKAGLLPVGVVDVEGTFAQQEAVRLCVVDKRRRGGRGVVVGGGSGGGSGGGGEEDGNGDGAKLWEGEAREVGRALSNYSSAEIARIKGRQSVEVEGILGYADTS
ncbi:hypothetical protein CHGG_03378 [Chaetomium globosum CBS 148.51]|uniref:PUA domain-containing protein n=1 Tax=Chaetomium globosum (strain ATCC 6205 / CBS 148.51 / DSM 1962 / NBRC 6347 / NRRL 1970) TaxID=306901 RepID=Q2H8S6_CHAGB|nr:uncharacterized protein CHGG_03378 [Chaetomium globosum CBS 148.51]EAQ91443.1 hypothetical protein CHGG_03378 [Chaetomium globosum CBS 148.51]